MEELMMKIVVYKPGSFMRRVLKMIFRVNKEGDT